MKKIIFLLFLFAMNLPIFSQKIENIHVDKGFGQIIIHFDLVEVNPTDIFNTTFYCSINNGPRFVIKNLGGLGRDIRLGKNQSKVWYYKKELSDSVIANIQDLEFFIQAEKLKKIYLPEKINDEIFFVGYRGSINNPLGLKLGMIGNWGGYLSYGGGNHGYYVVEDPYTLIKYSTYSISAGAIKWITGSHFYVYSGIGLGDWADYYNPTYQYWTLRKTRVEANAGIMYLKDRYYLDIGTSIMVVNSSNFLDISDLSLGVGITF